MHELKEKIMLSPRSFAVYGIAAVFLPLSAYATTVEETIDRIPGIADRILNMLIAVAFTVAAIGVIFAAFAYMTSGGDEEKLKRARGILIAALTAGVLAFLVNALFNLLFDIIDAE